MQLRRSARGFTLTELAVVFAIVTLLMGGAMATFSAQIDQRNDAETRRRLDAAVEAVLGFAIVNRRLPCPAVAGATGDESPAGGAAPCTTYYAGFLPGRTLGFQPTNASGYAIDAWGNPIRYAVTGTLDGTSCTSTAQPHFTSVNSLKANGVGCRPNDIVVCATSAGITPPTCGTAPPVTNQSTVVFLVLSTGKNGGNVLEHGNDELANTNGDAVFIYRTPGAFFEPVGSYDDLVTWVPVGILYWRLISAGVLP